jgi:hypothetical protein
LEVALRKAYEDIINGTASVEPRDMIKIVEVMRKWDAETQQVQVDILRAQVSAIEEAIKRKAPKDLWIEIVKEAKAIYAREGFEELPQRTAPEVEVVDAL